MLSKILLWLLVMTNAYAIDFGKEGQGFRIEEQGFIEMLKQNLQKIDIEKAQKEMQEKARERVENPEPVMGIYPATKDREFYYDPSYIVDKDIYLPCGTVLHKVGTKVNPLEHMDLERVMYFIDARQDNQIEWLEEELKKEVKAKVEKRVILVGGSVFKMRGRFEDIVYFDQMGEMTSRFGVKASPAVAQQEGLMIQIKEINLKGD